MSARINLGDKVLVRTGRDTWSRGQVVGVHKRPLWRPRCVVETTERVIFTETTVCCSYRRSDVLPSTVEADR